MKHFNKAQLLFIFFITVTLSSFSQYKVDAESYHLLQKKEGIAIYTAQGNYEEPANDISHQRIFLKFENTTEKKIKITFQREVHYGEKCYGCTPSPESIYSLILPAQTSYSFDNTHNDKRFYIFQKDNNGWIDEQLTGFAIKILK